MLASRLPASAVTDGSSAETAFFADNPGMVDSPMKNIVIVTAKGGNRSVENKNIIPILGVPVVLYPIRAAKLASAVDGVFLSTEDTKIRSLGEKEGVEIIERPPELARPESLHADVIRHAVETVSKRYPDVDNVIVLLGNTVMVTPGIMDTCLELLGDPAADCDSVLTVWKAQDDHPFRALTYNESGYVESFLNIPCGSNRQTYPPVYYYDQGIWAMKASCAIRGEGPVPWTWLGRKCRMIERPWVTGRDIHSWIDVSASSWYLNAIQANDFLDYREVRVTPELVEGPAKADGTATTPETVRAG